MYTIGGIELDAGACNRQQDVFVELCQANLRMTFDGVTFDGMTFDGVTFDPASLEPFLEACRAHHRHICPRQVLGIRMSLWAAELLELVLPQEDKRVLTIVETDGCFCDGVAVAANCWVGRRTLRVEDYGKVAATFVDTRTEQAWRIHPHPDARTGAGAYAPAAKNRWERMLYGYQRMPTRELLVAQPVRLHTPVRAIISRAGRRVNCARCGEEIINEREVVQADSILCRACAGNAYYRPALYDVADVSDEETPAE